MNTLLRLVRSFFVSLKLTVVLLALGIVLIFAATLAQVDLGIWTVQEKFFRSFVAVWHVGGLYVPLPGGYLVGGLLIINLTAAHIARFQLTWKKAGIQLTHAGLILLLLGELLSGLWQEDYAMRLEEGQPKDYSESYRLNELAIADVTDEKFEDVVAIPEEFLARHEPIQHPKLPFRVVTNLYFPNSIAQPRAQVPNPPPSPATKGFIAERYVISPESVTYKQNERNLPAAAIELVASDGVIGSWLVTTEIPVLRTVNGEQVLRSATPRPQRFDYGGRTWEISLRSQRAYRPFTLTLLKFSNDVYAGTDIPKNYSSRVRLTAPGGRETREVLIYMNNPLRYAGLTFYQASFDRENPNVTILQVVRNPSWLLPYIACIVMTLGLVWQFGYHLVGFARKRRSAEKP